MSPDWSAKEDPVPYAELKNPQSLNLYSYVLNNPLGNVDPDGHACSAVLFNLGTAFCKRAADYGKLDAMVGAQTRFFAAASAASQFLADTETPLANFPFIHVSDKTQEFLRKVGQKLQRFNSIVAGAIEVGSLGGPGLDARIVQMEQTQVQGSLDELANSDPTAYNKVIQEINAGLNPTTVSQWFGSIIFGTDNAYAQVLDDVRTDLGRNIDFSIQADREAIGNKLIEHVRTTGGCDVAGDMVSGC